MRRWEASTGQERLPTIRLPTMRHEHSRLSLTNAAFSRDENRILSWYGDTVRLWEASTGQELVPTMRHRRGVLVLGAAFSPNENRILSWDNDHIVRLWDIPHLPAGNLLEVACKLLPNQDVSDQDVSDLNRVYGIRITNSDPICGPDMPPPDWSQTE